jgi:anti-sigma regulatory factor (Ser/Thr protein kinase)
VTSNTTRLELTLPAVPASVRRARSAVGTAVEDLAPSSRLVDDVQLCVIEAVTNVVRHAYGSRRGTVDVVVERADDELLVRVRDAGKGIQRSRSRAAGGFGLRIIEQIARDVTVKNRPESGTEVSMVFGLDGRRDGRPRMSEAA